MTDVFEDLQITRIERQSLGGSGTWVQGRLAGYRFDALVFAGHAEVPEYEYQGSRISKLWVQRLADRKTVFHWDRGPDVEAADELTREIVEFLASGLADSVLPCE